MAVDKTFNDELPLPDLDATGATNTDPDLDVRAFATRDVILAAGFSAQDFSADVIETPDDLVKLLQFLSQWQRIDDRDIFDFNLDRSSSDAVKIHRTEVEPLLTFIKKHYSQIALLGVKKVVLTNNAEAAVSTSGDVLPLIVRGEASDEGRLDRDNKSRWKLRETTTFYTEKFEGNNLLQRVHRLAQALSRELNAVPALEIIFNSNGSSSPPNLQGISLSQLRAFILGNKDALQKGQIGIIKIFTPPHVLTDDVAWESFLRGNAFCYIVGQSDENKNRLETYLKAKKSFMGAQVQQQPSAATSALVVVRDLITEKGGIDVAAVRLLSNDNAGRIETPRITAAIEVIDQLRPVWAAEGPVSSSLRSPWSSVGGAAEDVQVGGAPRVATIIDRALQLDTGSTTVPIPPIVASSVASAMLPDPAETPVVSQAPEEAAPIIARAPRVESISQLSPASQKGRSLRTIGGIAAAFAAAVVAVTVEVRSSQPRAVTAPVRGLHLASLSLKDTSVVCSGEIAPADARTQEKKSKYECSGPILDKAADPKIKISLKKIAGTLAACAARINIVINSEGKILSGEKLLGRVPCDSDGSHPFEKVEVDLQ